MLTVIEPFDRSPNKSPFNEAELAVIATLRSYPCALNRTDVFCWIAKMFTYYNHQLIDTCAQSLHNKAESRSHLGGLLEPRLGKPSKQYDVPLRGICPEAP